MLIRRFRQIFSDKVDICLFDEMSIDIVEDIGTSATFDTDHTVGICGACMFAVTYVKLFETETFHTINIGFDITTQHPMPQIPID